MSLGACTPHKALLEVVVLLRLPVRSGDRRRGLPFLGWRLSHYAFWTRWLGPGVILILVAASWLLDPSSHTTSPRCRSVLCRRGRVRHFPAVKRSLPRRSHRTLPARSWWPLYYGARRRWIDLLYPERGLIEGPGRVYVCSDIARHRSPLLGVSGSGRLGMFASLNCGRPCNHRLALWDLFASASSSSTNA